MPEKEQRTIVVFDIAPEVQVGLGGRPLQPRGIAEILHKLVGCAVPVEQVQQNMLHFLSNIQEILARGAELAGEFEVDTVEINAQISADGQVGFMGTNVGMAGNAGITFTLKRQGKQSLPALNG